MAATLTLADVQAAAERLRGEVVDTPCLHSRTLSALAGCEVFLKFENHQFTASFKERGALNKMAQLGAAERAAGVLAVSAGNHAQGVAYHAQRMGIPAVIVMPRFAPAVKVENTRRFGATVVLEGRVGGGATFRSKMVTTDSTGNFKVELLPPDDGYSLSVFPASGARSGFTQQIVKVKNTPGQKPTFDPQSIRCIERIPVKGQVMLPTGLPAANLSVRAVETKAIGKRPLPLEDVDVLTDTDGRYELFLDPGNWRLEFTPSGELPQTSRLITVSAAAAADGGTVEGQSFAPITLPSGRRLTGVVTTLNTSRGSSPLANAQVRFFRVTTIEGKPAAVLLGSGITNSIGAYSVILPTRELPKQ